MIIDSDTRVVRDAAHVAAMTGEREVAVMNVAQGAYYGLNEVATRIWQLIEEPRSVASLCGTLEAEYTIDHASCEREVVECLEMMVREGLVRILDGVAV
jgi:hypothetical protein